MYYNIELYHFNYDCGTIINLPVEK